VTIILLAILVMGALTLGWFQQRSFNQTVLEIYRRSSEDNRDWGTKALTRSEGASKVALQAVSKTNDSLCLIFQNQMAPAQRQTVEQPELALAWEGSGPLHPQEVREAVEDQLERRRQWMPLVPRTEQVWSDPAQVAEALKESQNGTEPPVDPSLVALDYDPSP
jgi:hypothetical protein